MRARFVILTLLLMLLVTGVVGAADRPKTTLDRLDQIDASLLMVRRPLVANLTGAAEVPGPGDPDGSGFALLYARPNNTTLCFVIAADKIAAPTAAHIHDAAAGMSGPVVITFSPVNAGASIGCLTGQDAMLITDILANPADYYVNVHNSEYPGGAIRGQLALGTRASTATLTGAAEVPGPGDPDGSGRALVTSIPGTTFLCYAVEVADIAAATAAHIHQAPAGMSGGVVVALDTPSDGFSAKCDDSVSAETIAAIRQNPQDYYINVHNSEYPGGAVRGQLANLTP